MKWTSVPDGYALATIALLAEPAAGMYVEPFHEKRTFFVGNPRGMGEAYSRVCRRFRTAFNADRAASIRSVSEALCTEAAQRPLNSTRKPN